MLCNSQGVAALVTMGLRPRRIEVQEGEGEHIAAQLRLTPFPLENPTCHRCSSGEEAGCLSLCAHCLSWFHQGCVDNLAEPRAPATQPPITVSQGKGSAPRCCTSPNDMAGAMYKTHWSSHWIPHAYIPHLGGGSAALERYNESCLGDYRNSRRLKRQKQGAHADDVGPGRQADPPPACRPVSRRTDVSAYEINPALDIAPPGEFTVNMVTSVLGEQTALVSVHSPDGRAVSPTCLSTARYRWLRAQHSRHA